MSKQQIIALSKEVQQLKVDSELGRDINKLFEFADKAKEFEDAWIDATGKKGGKPSRVLNPYRGKTVNKSAFKPTKENPLYKKTFIKLSRNFDRNDFIERLIRDFSDESKDTLEELIKNNREKIPELVNRYIRLQQQGIERMEQQLASRVRGRRIRIGEEKQDLESIKNLLQGKIKSQQDDILRRLEQSDPALYREYLKREGLQEPDISIDISEGRMRRSEEVLQRLLDEPPMLRRRIRPTPEVDVEQQAPAPQIPQSAGERIQNIMGDALAQGDRGVDPAEIVQNIGAEPIARFADVVARGIDIGRLPFDQLYGNLARRVMNPNLLTEPAMARRRGRGGRNWRDWIIDIVKKVGQGILLVKTIKDTYNYLYHTIIENTPKAKKDEQIKLLRGSGIVPDGTIDDALKTKETLEELFETYKRERRQAEATPEATPEAQAEPTQEVIMDDEEFERLVREAEEIERRQREQTQTEDPQPPKIEGETQTHPDFRKGHMDKVRLEQLLRLKKEEEDRRIAELYTQNPDDYMSAPVPNPYMRPMYSDEWVDVKRLQRLQTPEYTNKEKQLWARNYQTPYQMGAGTMDNAVKDIKNVVERLAQLEHKLRYDYATQGLPRDERQPSINWGMPINRAGITPKSSHQRWDAYLDVVNRYDMDKYQYSQRQNEPPRSKPINREAQQFKPTSDITSQQKIYDEFDNEKLPELDIKNEMDYAYFYRRIRKQ